MGIQDPQGAEALRDAGGILRLSQHRNELRRNLDVGEIGVMLDPALVNFHPSGNAPPGGGE